MVAVSPGAESEVVRRPAALGCNVISCVGSMEMEMVSREVCEGFVYGPSFLAPFNFGHAVLCRYVIMQQA